VNYSYRAHQRRRFAILAVVAVAVLVVAYLLLSGGDDDDDDGSGPVAAGVLSADELRERAGDVNFTVYWAGPRDDTRLEFERTDEGNVFVRYLPEEGDPADERSDSLTIGSYPVGDAVAGLKVVAKRPGAETYDLPGEPKAIVVSNENAPNSVYVALPDSAVQVEVYHPDPKRALETVLSGEVVPLS